MGGPFARRRSGKAIRGRLAEAHGLPAYWLDLDPEPGAGLPRALVPLAVARSFGGGVLPEDVRAMPEDDVIDQLQWMEIESLVARMHRVEMEKARRS